MKTDVVVIEKIVIFALLTIYEKINQKYTE